MHHPLYIDTISHMPKTDVRPILQAPIEDYTPINEELFLQECSLMIDGLQVNTASNRTKIKLKLLSNKQPKSNHFRDARNEV